jgi:hypothetical protein
MWDETKEKLYEREIEFVETESNFINGGLSHTKEVAQAMAQDHRYLVGQKGQLYIEFLKVLAKYERKGWYDARNEHVCKMAAIAINALVESGELFIPYDEREELGLKAA